LRDDLSDCSYVSEPQLDFEDTAGWRWLGDSDSDSDTERHTVESVASINHDLAAWAVKYNISMTAMG